MSVVQSGTATYYCNEAEFKNSLYGQKKIQQIKNNLATANRPITDNYFTTTFLKSYYISNTDIIQTYISNCYERLLDFWVNDRINALQSESDLAKGNENYNTFLSNLTFLDKAGTFFGESFNAIGKGIADIWDYLKILLLAIIIIAILYLVNEILKNKG